MERMRRTQIYLDPDLDMALRRAARQRGMSKAALIRLAAQRFLQQERSDEPDPLLGLIGLGNSGPGSVSEEHDRVLVQESIRNLTT